DAGCRVGLRATLGPVLRGVRQATDSGISCQHVSQSCTADNDCCSGICGEKGCSPRSLSDVCHGIPMSAGTGQPGDACSQAGDCQSGLCLGDAPNRTCQVCGADTDCGGNAQCPGKCDLAAGACMLACNDNQILTPSACTALAPPFAGAGTVG